MAAIGWFAALVLFLQLPIPLYWFVVHPQVSFWRRHQTAAFVTGVLLSWVPVTTCIVVFRDELFCDRWPPVWMSTTGFALIIFESWIFWRVKRDLGVARLVGKTELSGGGDVVHRGIYARIRHPRYVGSFLAIVGACFLAGTQTLWFVAAIWSVLTLVAIAFEERELRARLGDTYIDYCRRVPRFLPLRWTPNAG